MTLAPPRPSDPADHAAPERVPVLEGRSLSRIYRSGHRGSIVAVKDVSLQLHEASVVALVGESGSGKTTVARLLAGQERPSAGEILLDGHVIDPAARRHYRAYKSEVQLVFQDPFSSLNPVHTVRYHLTRPLRIHRGRLTGDTVAQRLDELTSQVRLTPASEFLAKYPHELSGGQRQRVAFARALAVQPRVLLADEPVSMLDVSIRIEMLSLLDSLRRRFRLALLYITHDIASARYLADEMLVMFAGRVVERGTAEDLTQRPGHPYTQALVAAAPDPDNLGRLLVGSGRGSTVASASAPASASGCPYSARCSYAVERCRAEEPPLLPLTPVRPDGSEAWAEPVRWAACWRIADTAPGLTSSTVPTAAPREGGGAP